MSKYNETIGQRIRRLRLEHGWSQEELGKKIALQRAAINKIETGATANLKQSHIIGLAEAFNVTPIYIMGWENTATNAANLSTNSSKEWEILLQNLQDSLDTNGIHFLQNLLMLNEQGRTKLYDYAQDLIDTKKYMP